MPKYFALLSILTFLALPFSVYAQANQALLKLTPSSATNTAGQSFTSAIKVTSTSTNISSVQAYLSFPADKLEVTSISKTGSIASLFIEEPSFDNVVGTIKMTADIASPGFKGSDGLIATITFKAKANGTANVNFTTESAVYPTSGTTSVLGTPQGGVYTVTGGSSAASASAQTTPSPTLVSTRSASGTPLPDTASANPTFYGILFGLSLIGLSAYLKLSKKPL